MNALRLYLRYLSASLRSQLEYPKSFLIGLASQFFTNIIAFAGVWSLFDRFGNLRGWTLHEVAVFYGLASTTFALADMLARGFDTFGNQLVRTGDFDRLLLRPRSTAFQVISLELRLNALGRFAQGALVLGIGLHGLPVALDLRALLLLMAATSAGVALFVGILIVQATLTFWTLESLELFNVLTYGGIEAMRYPLSIFERWLRQFLTFVVPFACVTYHPVLAVLRRPDPLGGPAWLAYAGPLLGVAFLGLALAVWSRGVRHYTSSGS